MDLQIYDKESFHSGHERVNKPELNVGVYGMISINRAASELMKLKPDSKISLAKDTKTNDWFIYENETGYDLREYKNGRRCFNHSKLAAEILNNIKGITGSVTFRISSELLMYEKMLYYCVITASAKHK